MPNTCMTSQGHVDKMAACIAKHANGRQIITSCYRRLVLEAASLLFLANKIENIDPPKVALFVGDPGPHIKHVSLRPLSLQPERLFDRSVQPFKHSSLVTDRQTDRHAAAITIVGIILVCYAERCGLIMFLFLFFSRPRSEDWPHHGRTFSIYPCPLSF